MIDLYLISFVEKRPVKKSSPPQEIKSSSPKPDFIEHPAGISLEDGDKATLQSKISGLLFYLWNVLASIITFFQFVSILSWYSYLYMQLHIHPIFGFL